MSFRYNHFISAVDLREIAYKYRSHPLYKGLTSILNRQKNTRLHLKGLSGSSKSMVFSNILLDLEGIHLFIMTDNEEAAYFYNDLQKCTGEDQVVFFPSVYKRSIQYNQTDNGNIILRSAALNRISEYTSGLLAVVTYPEAIAEKVLSRNDLATETLHLAAGEKVSIDFIREVLEMYRFELVDFVSEPGQYACRGSIMDIFSYSNEFPFRVDFFGDEVESIRTFNVENQLSVGKEEHIIIQPNIHTAPKTGNRLAILMYAEFSCVWCNDFSLVTQRLEDLEETVETHIGTGQAYTKNKFISDLQKLSTVEFNSASFFKATSSLNFNTRSQPLFQKNFTLLGDNLINLISEGYDIYILSDSARQIERLHDIFKDAHKGIPFKDCTTTIHEGFIDDDLRLSVYTDHQIFDRYHKFRLNKYFSSKANNSLKELKDLNPGDYIVHVDHGIGRFGGLEKIEVNGKIQEAIKLVYRDNDILYVGIHSLHRISKYKGKDDSEPKMYKLGSGAWQKLKQSTKSKIKDIAKDLIQLYAKRQTQKGFQFSPDTYLQEELEASFVFEDTPDQWKATQTVKSDMETETPMDRLICGDVGFGKTEVAIRAAFKAVTDSKQVAILVPTTILALQHYNTFKDRLKNFPCTVEHISRLKKPAVQKKILAMLEEGKIDIIIGTHRILGKDIRFKDLGLLIIDEEQKFGVAAKEKLKSLKVNVDTLTMTATPIPRTLQFSLMGARDLSIINTPPPNRHPIFTEIHTVDENIIQEGIDFELSREGQVFFIYNRIQVLYDAEVLIQRLCPNAKTAVAHGQMEGVDLENIMIGFINGDYDVLIATSIIESGLDIPNANTIFINEAQNFGLSDLHQLRGRVGRSDKNAFCYLLAPPIHTLTAEARRRLKAIEEFSELGSGFNLSLQDLDIRGSGNILGSEQSGFIADLGFETYSRILNEAILELREYEPGEKAVDEPMSKFTHGKNIYVTDCIIDTDMEIHIPDEYVSNIAERVRLYRQLDNAGNEQELEQFRNMMEDRFGTLPDETECLFIIVRLRWVAQTLGFEKISIKDQKMICFFISNPDSSFFSSAIFLKMMTFVQKKPGTFQMREGKQKLTLTIKHVDSIDTAYNYLMEIKSFCYPETEINQS